MIQHLPTVNACLNALSFLMLCGGYLSIRRENRRVHIRFMVAALISSALFLVSYLTYHYVHGDTVYDGPGRGIYLVILGTHIVLAASLVVLVPMTVVRAAKSRYTAHKRIAKVTFPIWIYVCVSGIAVYLILHT